MVRNTIPDTRMYVVTSARNRSSHCGSFCRRNATIAPSTKATTAAIALCTVK